MLESNLQHVLSSWPATIRVESCVPLGNRGGLSGAALWKVTNDLGSFCLRRWPTGNPSSDRLRWIHDRLLSAASAGCHFIPTPWPSFQGATFVAYQDHLWELTPWMPGRADFRDHPSEARLESAMRALAQLHQGLSLPQDITQGPAPGLERRWLALQAEDLSVSLRDRWPRAIERLASPRDRELLREMLTHLPRWLEPARTSVGDKRSLEVPLQACVRDLWHSHVLFEEDHVSGIVDFGAMQIDSVCADLTRLLGTLIDSSASLWRAGLTTYGHLHPLSSHEQQLLVAYDISSTFLSSVQWLRWICDEEREFEDTALVSQRLHSLLNRLRDEPWTLWNNLQRE